MVVAGREAYGGDGKAEGDNAWFLGIASARGNFTSSKADSKADSKAHSKALSKRELSGLSLQPLFSILHMRKRLTGRYK